MSDGAGAERVRELIRMAEEIKPEPPRPLMRELPPADPFPVETLGSALVPAARAIYDRVQAPLAICGQSVLAAATLAVQAHADVALPIGDGQRKPMSNYFVTVAASGERKSACDFEATQPIRMHEKELREKYDADILAYANDKAAWDKAREMATKRGRGDFTKIKQALGNLDPAPVPPLAPLLTCPEPTYEGLCKLLVAGQPSVGIFAAEGGQFIGGHGMNNENKLKTASGLSDVWDGSAIRRVRMGDAVIILPGRRLSMHLMLQPDVAAILFRDRLLADQGLLSRQLITAPDTAMGTRMSHEEAPQTEGDLKRYRARVLKILESPLPLALGKSNELEPRPLPLSPAARSLWFKFADHVEISIGPGGDLEAIRGLANKLPEHGARIAGVLTLVDDIGAGEISHLAMAAGIQLAQHYAAEALRLHGASRIDEGLRRAQQVLDWLLSQWKERAISLPDIYQRGPNSVRDAASARSTVAILEEHGWLIRIPDGAVVAGVWRKEAWLIVRG
jgi:hypothetical protein